MNRIYNQKEMRAMDTATKLLEENRITLGEYHKFIELVNNGTYMRLIGGMELMKDGFVFSGIKMSNENKGLLIDGDTVNKALESIGVAAANVANTNRTLADILKDVNHRFEEQFNIDIETMRPQ